ncbi:MAG: NifU family protein [Planctomycetota bacterium]
MLEPLRLEIEDVPESSDTCVVVVNRPVAPGAPLYYSTVEEAADNELARRLLQAGGLEAVLLQDTITLLKPVEGVRWAEVLPGAEQIIRAHFDALDAARAAADRDMTAAEEALAENVQAVLDAEINPMVASHGGVIQVLAVKDRTLFVHMGGGCQGCAMSTATLKQGVETAVRRHFAEIESVLDTTDHAAGANPYYRGR